MLYRPVTHASDSAMPGNFAETLEKGLTGCDIVLFGRHVLAFRRNPGHSKTVTYQRPWKSYSESPFISIVTFL
jgi:hypothetical protein